MAAVAVTVLNRNVQVGQYRMTTFFTGDVSSGAYIERAAHGFQEVKAAWGANATLPNAPMRAVINSTTGSDTTQGDVFVAGSASNAYVTVIGR